MNDWRRRMQARRRARRRYLAVAFERWRAEGGAPRTHGRTDEVLITLLWLLVPGMLAVVCALFLLAREATQPVEMQPVFGLVGVPVLVVWLLRGSIRR